jgi:hypothetical protein
MSAVDALARPLSSSESTWLAIGKSPLSMTLYLTPACALKARTPGVLARAAASCRHRHPYLGVAIDAAQVRAHTALAPVPLSEERVATLDNATVREAVRAQLHTGVDLGVSTWRVHVVVGAASDQECALILLGDHMMLDGRSFIVLANDLVTALDAGAEAAPRDQHDFVDWTQRVPPLQLPAFDATPTIALPPAADAEPTADGLVRDLVVTVDAAVMAALKVNAKAHGMSLNAPLMVAFQAAVVDAAIALGAEQASGADHVSVRSLCAVETRSLLAPPLPADYIGNVAGVVSVTSRLGGQNAPDLWLAAVAAHAAVRDAIAALEPFRMHDITKRAAYAEMAPIFTMPCLWSNVGCVAAAGIARAEFHLTGPGSNPVVSAHVVTAAATGALALTVTYAPACHTVATARLIGERFVHHVGVMSAL